MMNRYAVLLRGINVGGKNKIPMTELKQYLEEQGFKDVTTYIQSGNVILKTVLDATAISQQIEAMLSKKFKLDSSIIKVLVLTHKQLKAVVDNKPKGFGEQPEKYHSDVIFLMGIEPTQAFAVFSPRYGVDKVWPGEKVIYSQRLSSERTKSRLSKIVGTPAYKFMTTRNWNTTIRLLEIIKANKTK